MIHESRFSWNTREVSDATTIFHQTKYQLYLFIFAQHFTVLYIFIQNPPQPTHICLYIFPPCFFIGPSTSSPFIQKNPIYIPSTIPTIPPPKVLAWQRPYCRSSRRCPAHPTLAAARRRTTPSWRRGVGWEMSPVFEALLAKKRGGNTHVLDLVRWFKNWYDWYMTF